MSKDNLDGTQRIQYDESWILLSVLKYKTGCNAGILVVSITPRWFPPAPDLQSKMCRTLDRVHTCGHFKRTIWFCTKTRFDEENPCKGRGTIQGSTTLSLCHWAGCDRKPNPKRDGPRGKPDVALYPPVFAFCVINCTISHQQDETYPPEEDDDNELEPDEDEDDEGEDVDDDKDDDQDDDDEDQE